MEHSHCRTSQPEMASRARKARIKRVIAGLGHRDSHCPRTVVLSYHSINPNHPMGIKPVEFQRQLRWLSENCTLLSIDQMVCPPAEANVHQTKAIEPSRIQVAITFDDGYSDMYDHALPLLRHFHIRATLFLVTAWTGSSPPRTSGLIDGLAMMSWDKIRELKEYNIHIECHTHSHSSLMGLSEIEMQREIQESKKLIEIETGQPVRYFAFPYGHPGAVSKKLAQGLRAMGFKAAFTTMWGPIRQVTGANRFLLPRLDIAPEDTISDFRRKVLGHYDYLVDVHRMKYAWHTVKRHFKHPTWQGRSR